MRSFLTITWQSVSKREVHQIQRAYPSSLGFWIPCILSRISAFFGKQTHQKNCECSVVYSLARWICAVYWGLFLLGKTWGTQSAVPFALVISTERLEGDANAIVRSGSSLKKLSWTKDRISYDFNITTLFSRRLWSLCSNTSPIYNFID